MPLKTLELLDAARAKLGSDYKVAQALGVTRQRVSMWRNRRDTFGDAAAVKVADLLGLDRGVVLAWMMAERSTSPDARDALLRMAAQMRAAVDKLAKGTAAAVALSLVGSTAYAPSAEARADASVYYGNSRRSPVPRRRPSPFRVVCGILHLRRAS